jgi:hypothetical protein
MGKTLGVGESRAGTEQPRGVWVAMPIAPMRAESSESGEESHVHGYLAREKRFPLKTRYFEV